MSPAFVRRLTIAVIIVGVLVALGIFVARIPRTMTIFLIAAFIAFGATPLVRRLEARLPRAAAISIVYIALLGFFVILALVVVPVTYAQLMALVIHAPDYFKTAQEAFAGTDAVLERTLGGRIELPTLAQLQGDVGGRVSDAITGAFAAIGTLALATANVLFISITALVLSVFFVARGPALGPSLLEFIPPRRRPEVAALFAEITQIFGHFVAGQAFLCVVVGVAVWVALVPSHFTFALLVAVICGLGYAVPFVGMIAAQVIAAALAIPQGPTMVIYVTVAIFLIARIADNVLVPKVMSGQVGVSPIGVMFAVFAGGELFGLPGLILGIPAAALIKVLFKYFVQPYVVRMQLAGSEPAEVVEVVHEQIHTQPDGTVDIVQEKRSDVRQKPESAA
ncbi:MAG: AI-2E family transporter [Candidatus Velthaea sp.]